MIQKIVWTILASTVLVLGVGSAAAAAATEPPAEDENSATDITNYLCLVKLCPTVFE